MAHPVTLWPVPYIFASIDPFNKYRISNFHPMTSNSLNKSETMNEIEKNYSKWKEFDVIGLYDVFIDSTFFPSNCLIVYVL